MLRAVSPVNTLPFQDLSSPNYAATNYTTIYLIAKILSGFCDVKPLTPGRIRQIAYEPNLSSLLEGQKGFRAWAARSFFLPLLEKHLPSLVETKLREARNILQAPLSFPLDFFHETLAQIIGYYTDVIYAYRQTANAPFLAVPVDKSIELSLEKIYLPSGGEEEMLFASSVQKILNEILFKQYIENAPWFARGPVAFFLHSVSYCLGVLLTHLPRERPKDPNPMSDQFQFVMRIALCRFLKEFKRVLQHSPHPSLGIDQQLVKTFLQKQTLISLLGLCTSQEQIQKILDDHSTLHWIGDTFAFGHAAKMTDEMLSSLWQVIENPHFRKKEAEHFLQSLNDIFDNPARLLAQENDVDNAMRELIEEILRQKLPDSLSFIKRPVAEFAVEGLKKANEQLANFWLKPYSLRFGVLHRQVLMRWVHLSKG